MLQHSFYRRTWFSVLSILFVQLLAAQPTTSPVLSGYIDEAMQNSHVIKEKQFLLNQSLLALEEARRLYYPDVAFGVSYTRAAGGRDISIPVGDLLNPVYGTLNQLTQTNAFPQIENVNEQFLPDNFYDARFRVKQPIWNAEIKLNREVKTKQVDLRGIEINLYRRELVRDIKSAYYRYQQAGEAVRIYDSALALLQESRRVNESLVRNDQAPPSVLVRSDGEIAGVEAQRVEAMAQLRNAAAYFNHLCGRPFDAAIAIDSSWVEQPSNAEQSVAGTREELSQLAKAQEINEILVALENSFRKPTIGAQLDVGSQNFDFKWGGYVLLGVSLEIPIYSAKRNQLQVEQAQVAGLALQEQTRQAENLIDLQVQTSRELVQSARTVWQSYDRQLAGARQYYRDVFRRYKEGSTNYIDVLEARTQLTNTDLRHSVARLDYLIRLTELERAVAGYNL
ncbi:MAG: TolC family protein [Lewinellaceae bacterium]|nr:TolC family protein [Lewinellaceae bacterium]